MADLIQQSPPSGMAWTGIQDQWSAMKEDKSATLFFPYGDEYAKTMTALRTGIGQMQTIAQPRWSWFERERMEVPFTVESVANASGVYTITIPSDEVDPSTGYSWPTPTSIWQHVESGLNFYIDDKPSQDTLVVKPVDNTDASLISIVAGDTFFYIGQTSPERSTGPQPQYYFSTQYTVGTQNFRHAKQSSGNSLFNQMWVDQLQNGVAVPYSNSQDVVDLQRIHNVAFINQFFANQVSNNLSDAESFNATSSTTGLYDGLLQTTLNRGQKEDTGGNPDETDFYALEAKLSKQDGSVRNYAVWMPGAVFAQISQNMLEYLKQTYIDTTVREFSDLFYDGSYGTDGMKTTLDFKYMTFQGKNWGMTRLGILDNPQLFNAGSGSQATKPWQNYAFFIPLGNGATDGMGNLGKYVRVLHKPQRFMKMWYTGAMSPQGNQTRVDELSIDILSEASIAFLMANNYGLFYKA